MIKDYYKILELEPSAGIKEIKKAYRRLALLFHPDKNADNPGAAVHYAEIKEAYEILSNPYKKQIYVQSRWQLQSQGKKPVALIITPENILKQVLELEKQVAVTGPYRFNGNAFTPLLLRLISDDTIERLNLFHDKSIHGQIVHHILKTIRSLHQFNPDKVIGQLKKLIQDNPEQLAELDRFHLHYFKKRKVEKWRLVFIFFITALVTLLIYLAGR